MKHCIFTLLAALAVVNVGVGTPSPEEEVTPVTTPPAEMVKRLTDVIQKHCPDAKIEVTKEAFIAKYATMKFTIHEKMNIGEARSHGPGFSPRTRQKEGPNLKGFILTYRLLNTPVPDQGGEDFFPFTDDDDLYYQTYIDHFYTSDGDQTCRVEFSYGKFVSQKLKQAILEAVPKSKRQKTTP